MLMRRLAIAPLILFAVSCREAGPPADLANAVDSARVPPAPPAPRQPPTSRQPGGAALPASLGAQGAGEVLRSYFALIGAGRYSEAWALRWKGRGDSDESARAFAASFGKYAKYRANVGTPGSVQSISGSSYVDVPVQIYGRMKDGKPFSTAGTVTLRRADDTPGAGAGTRRWRIYASD
jgi:hypothetical protein